MKKLFLTVVALLATLFLASGAFCADGDELTTNNFRIDGNGSMWHQALIETVSTNDTVTATESGKIFLMSGSSSDEIVMTLPAASNGLIYTFTSINPNSNKYELSPNGTDKMIYSTAVAGNRLVSVGGIGDSVTIIATGDSAWAVDPNVTFTVKVDD